MAISIAVTSFVVDANGYTLTFDDSNSIGFASLSEMRDYAAQIDMDSAGADTVHRMLAGYYLARDPNFAHPEQMAGIGINLDMRLDAPLSMIIP